MTRDDADAFQDWAAMGGEQAFLLIERHADGFQVAHELMEAWARARVKAEREACAKAIENSMDGFHNNSEWADGYIQATKDIADGIRARGDA